MGCRVENGIVGVVVIVNIISSIAAANIVIVINDNMAPTLHFGEVFIVYICFPIWHRFRMEHGICISLSRISGSGTAIV